MRYILIILSIIFTFTVISCNDKDESTSDTSPTSTDNSTAEVTAVTTPTNDSTPDYTFSTDDAGGILYGGSCSSNTSYASSGNNTITLNSLSDGTYSDCSIAVRDYSGNLGNTLTMTSFEVDATAPIVAEVTAVTTPKNDLHQTIRSLLMRQELSHMEVPVLQALWKQSPEIIQLLWFH